MCSCDLITLRKAASEFTPSRPQRFQDLLPAKDVISELRSKRASYRQIAEMLTEHCLPASKTAIAAFCHKILGEIVRPHRKTGRRAVAGNGATHKAPVPAPTSAPLSAAPLQTDASNDNQIRPRGPRIAQVRMLKPQSL